MTRTIPVQTHGAVEILLATALVALPLALGLGPAAVGAGFAIGVLLIGLAVSVYGDGSRGRAVPLSAHAGFDYALALAAIVAGIAIGIATGELAATIFMVGIGAAMTALTAQTRFSAQLGA